MVPIRASKTVTVAADLVTVLSVDVAAHEYLYIVFTVGTAALDQFAVKARALPEENGILGIIASAAGDYTSPGGNLIDASGDLTIASTTGSHWVTINVGPFHVVELQCASGTTSVVTMQASGC